MNVDSNKLKIRAFVRCLRPHQWGKNFIIFIPALAGHKLGDPSLMLNDTWAFVAFCLCASGVYIFNDLTDISADRNHPLKKNRPFARGDLSLRFGLVAGSLLLAAGILVAAKLSYPFIGILSLYLVLATIYSLWIRRVVLLDVFFLAGLYTIRLVAGHIVTNIAYSAWLLMFSMFTFLSLALVKRYVELESVWHSDQNKSLKTGRGYRTNDLELVASLGTCSGYLATLVLALYVNSQQVLILYKQPLILLFICPLWLFWISRVWLIAHRGEMHNDPVTFAIKDMTSYAIGGLMLLVLWLATIIHAQ